LRSVPMSWTRRPCADSRFGTQHGAREVYRVSSRIRVFANVLSVNGVVEMEMRVPLRAKSTATYELKLTCPGTLDERESYQA
jgi:hypothetical protein